MAGMDRGGGVGRTESRRCSRNGIKERMVNSLGKRKNNIMRRGRTAVRPYNNNMKTILVVDDEPKITQLVRDYLERAGFGVIVAFDGRKALSLAKTERPDAVILDLGLPQLDGLDFTREFRKTSNAPIIMLTARSEESDKLIGLELGADDYMTKPFSPKELVARVRVVFRRIENTAASIPARR
jgi:DNA-binding response OmpR family regulator